MKKSILIVSSFLLATSSAMAAPADSTIKLGGGELGPLQILNVSLAPLMPNVYYSVTCDIVNNNNFDMALFFNEYHVATAGKMYLNKKLIGSSATMVTGKASNSFLCNGVVINKDTTPNLQFINPDYTHSVTVENCEAKPNVGSIVN